MEFYRFDDLSHIKDLCKNDSGKQYVSEWCDAWPVDRVDGDAEKCPLCGRYTSMREWLEPRKMRLTNTRYPDRLWAYLLEPLVVSKRFKH